MFTFKRITVKALAFGLMASIVSAGAAFATPTYTTDSGVSYERSGKFMERAIDKAAPVAKSARSDTPSQLKVSYDKGDLGKYERHGRFVHRIVDKPVKAVASDAGFNAPEQRVRNVGLVKHVRRS